VTVADRVRQVVLGQGGDVFIRREFDELGGSSQVGRALAALVSQGMLVKLGVGVYARAKKSVLSGKPIPIKPLEVLAPIALQKLGVAVNPSRLVKLYNEGRSTQVPAGVVLNTGIRRIRRRLGFNGKTVGYERS
jgi:hypothetical protein